MGLKPSNFMVTGYASLKIISKRVHQLILGVCIIHTSHSSALIEGTPILRVLHWLLIIFMWQTKQQTPKEKFQLWQSVYLLYLMDVWRENIPEYTELTSNSREASNSQIFIAVLVLSFWSYEARGTFVFIVALLSPSSSITGVCSAPIQMFKTEKRPSLKITVRLGMPYDLHILLNAVTIKFFYIIYTMYCSKHHK